MVHFSDPWGHQWAKRQTVGAQTYGKTHGKTTHHLTLTIDAENLAGRPKYTNPYPWRDPYRGIHKGGRPPKAAAPLCGGGAKRRLLYGWVYGGRPS